jgi:hypothetical protein
VRHGGIIPWDTDIDLGYLIPAAGIDCVAPLKAEFKKKGLILQRNRTNAYWQVGTNAENTVISAQHIDLFPYALDAKTNMYLNADERFREPDPAQSACNAAYKKDELFPLREGKFYNDTIPLPAKAEEVLDRVVKGWRDKAVIAGESFPLHKGLLFPA